MSEFETKEENIRKSDAFDHDADNSTSDAFDTTGFQDEEWDMGCHHDLGPKRATPILPLPRLHFPGLMAGELARYGED